MSKLTREEAIKKFRDHWNWISATAKERQKGIERRDYFKEVVPDEEVPLHRCYLCEYVNQVQRDSGPELLDCRLCPIDFGLYRKCTRYPDYMRYAYNSEFWDVVHTTAHNIANLPEKEMIE